MPRERTYFVSDVHLGLDVKDAAGRERRFIRFLRSIPAAETEALYLLGDIWDFWYEYRDVVPKGYVGVFAALQELMAAGVKVYFLRGNHDIWSYRYFEELGMVRLEQPHVTRIGGLTLCLGHGDGLGPVPRRYRFIRSLFHNRVCQALFSALHPWIAFRLGEGWSRRSRLARAGAYVFQGEQEPLWQWAAAFPEPVDLFVFGHYHCRVDAQLPSGARFVLLGDWMDASPFACLSAGNLQQSELP